MDFFNTLLNQMQAYEKNERLCAEEYSSWPSIGLRYGYFEYDSSKRYGDQLYEIDLKLKENKFFINEGITTEKYNELANKCPFEIPKVLEDFWKTADGFLSSWSFLEPYETRPEYSRLGSSILPMIGAFGGIEEIENDMLLSSPLINYELFESNMEMFYDDESKVNLEAILDNCILLEIFSEDSLTFTLYKMDHNETGYDALYLTYGGGIYPLKLSLEEYFEAQIEMRGIIFAWPILFVNDENTTKYFRCDKENALRRARLFSEYLGLNINFDYHLLNR